MKFSTSNHSSSSSVVLFLSLGFQFANNVSAKSSIRGLQTGNAAVTATVPTPPTPPATPTEPDACVTDCGIGPWSTLCLHLQTSLSTGIDFDTAMGDYDFTAMELEMISNSTALIEDDVPPGPPGSIVEPGSPAAGGMPGPSDSNTGPSKTGASNTGPTGPSMSEDSPDSPTGPSGSLDEPPTKPSMSEDSPDSPTGPSGSADGSPTGPSGSADGGPDSPTGPSGSADGSPTGPSGSADGGPGASGSVD